MREPCRSVGLRGHCQEIRLLPVDHPSFLDLMSGGIDDEFLREYEDSYTHKASQDLFREALGTED